MKQIRDFHQKEVFSVGHESDLAPDLPWKFFFRADPINSYQLNNICMATQLRELWVLANVHPTPQGLLGEKCHVEKNAKEQRYLPRTFLMFSSVPIHGFPWRRPFDNDIDVEGIERV